MKSYNYTPYILNVAKSVRVMSELIKEWESKEVLREEVIKLRYETIILVRKLIAKKITPLSERENLTAVTEKLMESIK